MKLFFINLFLIITLAVLCILDFLLEGYRFYALLLALFTGVFQVVAGLNFLIKVPSVLIYTYVLLTSLFFFLWYFTDFYWIIAMPPALAIYMSVIIYLNSKLKTI